MALSPGASSLPSTSMINDIFLSLPNDARLQAVEHILLPLLGKAPTQDLSTVLSALHSLKNKYIKCPDLDLRQRKAEIDGLLHALDTDYKRGSVIRGRSIRHEILDEALKTLGTWLNDAWIVTFEFEIEFEHAHFCLLEISSLVEEVFSAAHGSCKCGYNRDTFEPLELCDHTGRLVKRFSRLGPDNINQATLWVWRDLFLAMLASGNQRTIAQLPRMFSDITGARGIAALERILYGGQIYAEHEYDQDDPEDVPSSEGDDDDDDSMDEGSDKDSVRSNAHAPHWSVRVERQMAQLYKHIREHLLGVFRLSPSPPLYHTLCRLYQDFSTAAEKDTPLRVLDAIVPLTPSALLSALNIYDPLNKPQQIHRLLTSYSYMLRPRHYSTLTFMALKMAQCPATSAYATTLLTKELLDVARTLQAMLRRVFPRIESHICISDLKEIMALLQGSLVREERIRTWVGSIALTSPIPTLAGAAVAAGPAGGAAPPNLVPAGPPPATTFANFVNATVNNPFWNPNAPPNAPLVGGNQAPLPQPPPAAAVVPPPQATVAPLNGVVNNNTANAAGVFGAGAPIVAAGAGGANPQNFAGPGGAGFGGPAGGGWPFVAAAVPNDDIEDHYGPNPGIFVTAQPGQGQTWGGWAGPHGSYSFGPLDFEAGPKRIGLVDQEDISTSWAAMDNDRWGSVKDLKTSSWMDELADLKEEFRPRMRERWDAWMELSSSVTGAGDVLMNQVYVGVLKMMPFFKAGDVVREMVTRLSERQSKQYICDALESVLVFCMLHQLATTTTTITSS